MSLQIANIYNPPFMTNGVVAKLAQKATTGPNKTSRAKAEDNGATERIRETVETPLKTFSWDKFSYRGYNGAAGGRQYICDVPNDSYEERKKKKNEEG